MFNFYKNFLIVIILTSTQGCALLSFESKSDENDPITRAAMTERKPAANQTSTDNSDEKKEEIKNALETGEIALGMQKEDVLSLWGQPQEILNAGNPELGNEKWIYSNSFFNKLKVQRDRIVYFEAGRVAGWENPTN